MARLLWTREPAIIVNTCKEGMHVGGKGFGVVLAQFPLHAGIDQAGVNAYRGDILLLVCDIPSQAIRRGLGGRIEAPIGKADYCSLGRSENDLSLGCAESWQRCLGLGIR